MKLLHARARRRFARGHVPMHLIRKLRKAKKEAGKDEKPATVKTHLRNMIIVPEMVASVVGVYNGLSYVQVEIKVGTLFQFCLLLPAAFWTKSMLRVWVEFFSYSFVALCAVIFSRI